MGPGITDTVANFISYRDIKALVIGVTARAVLIPPVHGWKSLCKPDKIFARQHYEDYTNGSRVEEITQINNYTR